MQSAFTPEAAFLVPAEGTRWVKFVVRIGPNHTGAELVYHLEYLAALVRPDACAQAVRSIVRTFDGFFRGAKGHDAEDRPKDFLLGDAMGHGHAGQKGRGKPITFCRQSTLRLRQFSAFI